MAIVAFITFILVLVVKMTTNQDLDHDLVVEEYYKQEIGFQDQLDRELNARQLVENIEVENRAEGLLVHFPSNMEADKITGTISLYRPSNKQLDFEVPVSLSSHSILIPDKHLVEGRWNISIEWKYGEEAYYFQQELTY